MLAEEELSTVVHTLLWINRINLHLTGALDAGVECRLLRMLLEIVSSSTGSLRVDPHRMSAP